MKILIEKTEKRKTIKEGAIPDQINANDFYMELKDSIAHAFQEHRPSSETAAEAFDMLERELGSLLVRNVEDINRLRKLVQPRS